MRIKVFGELNDIIMKEDFSIDDVIDTNELKKNLYELFPELQKKKFAVAVNKQIINENVALQADAEIALLPPFSGG